MKFRSTVFPVLITLFALVLGPHITAAQSLTVQKVKMEVTAAPGDIIETYADVKNITSSSVSIRLLRTKAKLPQDWSSSFCFGEQCYAPGVSDVTLDVKGGSDNILKVTFESATTAGDAEIELVVTNNANPSESYTLTFTAHTLLSSTADRASSPRSLALSQNYPNPFSLSESSLMKLGFSTPRAGNVNLKVYNLLGSEVRTIMNDYKPAGTFVVTWDARDYNGALLPSGIYIVKLTSGTSSLSRRVVISR